MEWAAGEEKERKGKKKKEWAELVLSQLVWKKEKEKRKEKKNGLGLVECCEGKKAKGAWAF